MRHFADNNGLVRFCWFSSVCCAGFSRDSHHAACPARWSARLFDGATGIWCLAQAALVFLSWQVGNLLENTEDAQGANYLQEGLRLAFSFAMIFQNLTLRLSTSITQLPPFGPFTCTSAVTTCDNSLSQLQAYALQQLCLECPGCGPRTSGPVARSFGVAEPRWLGILRYGKIANGWTFGVQSLQPWAQRDTMALVCTCSDVHGKWNRLFRTKRELEFRKWRFPDLNSTHVWFHFYFSRLASWTRKSRHLEQHGNDLCIWAGQCQGKGYNWQKKLWTHQEPKITGSLKVSLRSMDIMDLIDSRLMKHYETIWNHMREEEHSHLHLDIPTCYNLKGSWAGLTGLEGSLAIERYASSSGPQCASAQWWSAGQHAMHTPRLVFSYFDIFVVFLMFYHTDLHNTHVLEQYVSLFLNSIFDFKGEVDAVETSSCCEFWDTLWNQFDSFGRYVFYIYIIYIYIFNSIILIVSLFRSRSWISSSHLLVVVVGDFIEAIWQLHAALAPGRSEPSGEKNGTGICLIPSWWVNLHLCGDWPTKNWHFKDLQSINTIGCRN